MPLPTGLWCLSRPPRETKYVGENPASRPPAPDSLPPPPLPRLPFLLWSLTSLTCTLLSRGPIYTCLLAWPPSEFTQNLQQPMSIPNQAFEWGPAYLRWSPPCPTQWLHQALKAQPFPPSGCSADTPLGYLGLAAMQGPPPEP